MKLLPLLVAGIVALAAPVQARTIEADPAWRTIDFDPGGFIQRRFQQESKAEKNGIGYEIRGTCASMCTIRLVYASEDRICTHPNAKWKFHAAMPWDGKEESKIALTDAMAMTYPEPVKKWFYENVGYDLVFGTRTLTGQQIHDMTNGKVALCR